MQTKTILLVLALLANAQAMEMHRSGDMPHHEEAIMNAPVHAETSLVNYVSPSLPLPPKPVQEEDSDSGSDDEDNDEDDEDGDDDLNAAPQHPPRPKIPELPRGTCEPVFTQICSTWKDSNFVQRLGCLSENVFALGGACFNDAAFTASAAFESDKSECAEALRTACAEEVKEKESPFKLTFHTLGCAYKNKDKLVTKKGVACFDVKPPHHSHHHHHHRHHGPHGPGHHHRHHHRSHHGKHHGGPMEGEMTNVESAMVAQFGERPAHPPFVPIILGSFLAALISFVAVHLFRRMRSAAPISEREAENAEPIVAGYIQKQGYAPIADEKVVNTI